MLRRSDGARAAQRRSRRPLSANWKFDLLLARLDERSAPGSILSTIAAQAFFLPGLGNLLLPKVPLYSAVADEPTDAPTMPAKSDTGDAAIVPSPPEWLEPAAHRENSIEIQWVDFGPHAESDDAAAALTWFEEDEPLPVAGTASLGGFDTGTRSGSPEFATLGSAPTRPSTGVIASAGAATPNAPGEMASAPASPRAAMATSAPAQTASSAATQTPRLGAIPAGRYSEQIQALLGRGGSGDAARSSMTSLIGGQLSGFASRMSPLSESAMMKHRGATLTGAADRFGSEMPIGFRTSHASTGLFNLVGTHSIGDMLDAHSPAPFDGRFERLGGLGIDGGSLPRPSAAQSVVHADSPSSDDGPTLANEIENGTVLGRGPESVTDAALFTLTMTVPSAGGEMTLFEEGVVAFPHDWDVNSPNYPIAVQYSYSITVTGSGSQLPETGFITWSGNASPNGQLAGYDIDEDNTSRFGMDWAQATYYRLEYAGSSTFVAIESGTRVEQVDGRTITRHYDNELHGIDVFSYSSEGTGAGLNVVWDCTTDAVFDNTEHGTDVRVGTSGNPVYWSGVFANTAQGTQQEIDHFQGTLIPRGAFTLAQFSIEQTGNYDFTGAGSGAGGSPLPGGSLTNNYTNQNQGQNSFQLSASGAPNDWIGSLADNTQSTFNDSDSGSASTTLSSGGHTESDTGTFSLTETGSHAESLSLSGDGDQDSFTITALSNHINDQFQFHGANGGTATYHSATESGSDSYHHTDDGTANEVLALAGTAASLTATYTNNILNGFTDTSNGNSNWSTSSPAGGSESGTVSSVNSESGSGNVYLSVSADMDGWQFGEGGEWDIDDVTINGGGLANVSSYDDGQASVIAADPNDTLSSSFNGSAAGTDSYSFDITGDGSDFTLTNRDLVNLNLNNADTDVARWTDPAALNGQATVTSGQQTVTFDDLSQATVDVEASRPLSGGRGPGGGAPPVTGTVDIQSNGGFRVGAVGSEQNYGSAANYMQNGINNSINMGQNVRVQTVMGANGRTTSVDHSLNGALNLNGWHNQTNALDPSQSAYEQGSGHLGGNVSGRLLSAGLVRTDGSTQADPSWGDFGVDVNGNTSNSVTLVYNTFLDPTLTPPSIGFEPVAAVEPLAFPPAMHPGGVLPTGAIVTVTHSISVPQFSLRARDEQAAGNWSLDELEYSQTTVETTSIFGDYTNCLLYPGGSGHAERTETERTEIELDSLGGSATGNMRVTTTVVGSAEARIEAPNYTGSANVSIDLTIEDRVSGDGSGAGANLTERITENGSSTYHHHLDCTSGGFETFDVWDVRDYSQDNALDGANSVLTNAGGTDTRTVFTETESSTETTRTNFWSIETWIVAHSVGADNQVRETPTHTLVGWITITDIPSGTSQFYPLEPPPPPLPEERPWYQFAVDFAAGMADSLTYGLTARARDALGLGSLVDINSGWYTGGEVSGTVLGLAIPGPCGKAGLIKGAINGLRVTQGAGSAINAAEAVRAGDPAGFLLNMGGAAFSLSHFNACFAAGTPIPVEHGCKAIEEIREGDIVLMRNEHDPVAPPVQGRVLSTFSTIAPVWELHAGGRVLRTTAGHPFWVRGKGWTAAIDLRPGQQLRTDADWVAVEAVRDTGASATVYNFEVDGEHTYFAGDPATWGWCLWAHNAGCRPIRGRPAHGDAWHNAQGVRRAAALERQFGRGNVYWNQALRDGKGNIISGAGKRPDIQAITRDGKVHLIELQSKSQSREYMRSLEDIYRQLLGRDFGRYEIVPYGALK